MSIHTSTMRNGYVTAALAVAAMAVGFDAYAQPDKGVELPLSDCLGAVGTFLTTNKVDGQADDFVSRSLISVTNGGHVFFTDSAASGETGYAPFSGGRGAWRCVSDEDGNAKLVGTVLDFTYPAAGEEQQIARLDIDATFDEAAQTLSGTMALYFVPIAGNPLDPADLKEEGTASFTGQKVTAP